MMLHNHAPRLGALAVLPLPDVDAALAEIAHALDVLDLDGVGLLSNYRGVYLGDPRLEPVMAELDRRKAVAFVHPTIPPPWDAFTLDIPAPVLEYTFDSTRMSAIAHSLNDRHLISLDDEYRLLVSNKVLCELIPLFPAPGERVQRPTDLRLHLRRDDLGWYRARFAGLDA